MPAILGEYPPGVSTIRIRSRPGAAWAVQKGSKMSSKTDFLALRSRGNDSLHDPKGLGNPTNTGQEDTTFEQVFSMYWTGQYPEWSRATTLVYFLVDLYLSFLKALSYVRLNYSFVQPSFLSFFSSFFECIRREGMFIINCTLEICGVFSVSDSGIFSNLSKHFQSWNKSLINWACSGLHLEDINPCSFLCGLRCAGSVLTRPQADMFLVLRWLIRPIYFSNKG